MNFALREWKSLSNRLDQHFLETLKLPLTVRETLVLKKKVGIFSFYLLRVSFSVRLNRIIILVERLMSLNGNLFSSLSFNRVWTIIPNPIHRFRFIQIRVSRPKNYENRTHWVLLRLYPSDGRANRIRAKCGRLWLANVRCSLVNKCTYAFCVGFFIVLLLKSR